MSAIHATVSCGLSRVSETARMSTLSTCMISSSLTLYYNSCFIFRFSDIHVTVFVEWLEIDSR